MPYKIENFLSTYDPDVSFLSNRLREFVMDAVPNCTETLHERWKVISYGCDRKFCAIAPHTKWVNLQFHNGASLKDEQKLLEGTGKSMRHAKVENESHISEALRTLIRQAAESANDL